jgi:hypothetical protein
MDLLSIPGRAQIAAEAEHESERVINEDKERETQRRGVRQTNLQKFYKLLFEMKEGRPIKERKKENARSEKDLFRSARIALRNYPLKARVTHTVRERRKRGPVRGGRRNL